MTGVPRVDNNKDRGVSGGWSGEGTGQNGTS